ncbi:MAG: tetratricopeptide repeat protein [Planctomycetaceae bacterium]|nr:tetratricopeptide repeat protein [Planctomycetaceae bacterium]MBV8384150.1 tetratricopeptide repeat protein [Planctomycetaceae bacterium]
MVYILSDLAGLLRDQGRYEEAELLYRRALGIVYTLNNLAGLLRTQGRYEEAEPLYRRALAIYETTLGPEHPQTGTCRVNLDAFLYRPR